MDELYFIPEDVFSKYLTENFWHSVQEEAAPDSEENFYFRVLREYKEFLYLYHKEAEQ